jgi:hypothetical protein
MCYSGKCPWEQSNGDCSLKSGEKCKFDFDMEKEYFTDAEIRQWATEIRERKIQELQNKIAFDEHELQTISFDGMSPEAGKFVSDVYIKDINMLKSKLSFLTR